MLFFRHTGISSQAGLHQQDVYYEADYEGPYVVDRVDECPECTLYSEVCTVSLIAYMAEKEQ